jgi:hypothetical protein
MRNRLRIFPSHHLPAILANRRPVFAGKPESHALLQFRQGHPIAMPLILYQLQFTRRPYLVSFVNSGRFG